MYELVNKEAHTLISQSEMRVNERNSYKNSVWEPDMFTEVHIWLKKEWILLLVMSSTSNRLWKSPPSTNVKQKLVLRDSG